MSNTPCWLDGPPTEPGLYWFHIQGSAKIRNCEVVRAECPLAGGINEGDLILAVSVDGSAMLASRPYRRWMSAGEPKPEVDLEWLDPRYLERKNMGGSSSMKKWWWLSFRDAKANKWLGGCWIRAATGGEAISESHRLGLNPGGEVIAEDTDEAPPQEERGRLLQKGDLELERI